ncbi:MAG: endolytic transglycosylase MltG, partial [Clostridia bacterium]|nr:endolytic transglycosylase MltG [Clostridia bacterium]
MEETQKKRFWNFKRIGILVLAALIVLGGCSVLGDFFGTGGKRDTVMVEIPEGSGASGIARLLKDEGIIRHPLLFKLYTRLHGNAVYQKGKHTVADSMSYQDILQVLESAPEVDERDIKKVVIPEGYELWQIVDLLVENGLGDKASFYHEIENGVFDFPFVTEIPRTENRLEGYLYPDTYLFSVQESEHEILSRMLENFSQKVLPVYHAYGTDKTLDEILIFASVIEREAANDEERPLVASVFKNRLEIGMRLESCATVQY